MSSGYDVPPLGLDNGQFYVIHVTAMLAMCASFTCASIVIGLFIKQRKAKRFYDRSKSERMIVYAAVCDATFNVIHSTEHIQMLVTKNLVLPRELCKFHGLMTLALGYAQVFLVLSVAVNIFCMMFLQKNITFGKYDWRLLTAVILGPFLIGFSSLIANKIGPNGAFCFFDSVTARQANFYLTTIPSCLVLGTNAILYGLTLYRIRSETKRLSETLGASSASIKRTHTAAKNMFLFLISFCVQWWAISVYGVWLRFAKGSHKNMLLCAVVTCVMFVDCSFDIGRCESVHLASGYPNLSGKIFEIIDFAGEDFGKEGRNVAELDYVVSRRQGSRETSRPFAYTGLVTHPSPPLKPLLFVF
ncbi:hypothetical protein KP79_PYT25312 [Mizuhopecten yessoensis]|uniref:G-protein coupled receptors family 1 profile domain-containing protein n=1 Tax=Mizuhopecten yessoensis TaxID=6573 RepID=A0A210PKV0_MIZYE|nr:hypothetical protein KP79_PYT25312 [Mizuhopecten yessoensis]